VFALSQLRGHAGVEPLLQVARTNRDPAVRRKALFWLGESGDPRAIALFREILMRG
jgi:HEAT repeat protein